MRKSILSLMVLLSACIPAIQTFGQAISSVGIISTNTLAVFVDGKHIKGATFAGGVTYDGTTFTFGVGTNLSIFGVNGTPVSGPNWTNTSGLVVGNVGSNLFAFPTNINTAQLVDGAITDAKINASGITSTNKLPGTIVNADRATTFTATQTAPVLNATTSMASPTATHNDVTATNSLTVPGTSTLTTVKSTTFNGNDVNGTNTMKLGGTNLYAVDTSSGGANVTVTVSGGRATISATGGGTNISVLYGNLGTIANGGTATMTQPTNWFDGTFSGAAFSIDFTGTLTNGYVTTITGTNSSGGDQIVSIKTNGTLAQINFPWGPGSTITNAANAVWWYDFAVTKGVLQYGLPINDKYNPAGGGTGTVTATGGSLTANAVVLGAGTTDTKVVAGIISDAISKLILGVAGSSVGSIDFKNGTSGTINVAPVTGALGSVSLVLPATSGTLALTSQLGSGGGTNYTLDTTQFGLGAGNTNLSIKSGSLQTNVTHKGPMVFPPSGTDSTNINWAVGQNVIQGITTNANFTNTFTGTNPAAGSFLSYVVNNNGGSTITNFFDAFQAIGLTNYYYNTGTSNVTSVAISAGTRMTFNWFYDGGRYYLGTLGKDLKVTDAAFASSWNGDTGTAPSRNAVYDYFHLFIPDDNGKINLSGVTTNSGVILTPKVNALVTGTNLVLDLSLSHEFDVLLTNANPGLLTFTNSPGTNNLAVYTIHFFQDSSGSRILNATNLLSIPGHGTFGVYTNAGGWTVLTLTPNPRTNGYFGGIITTNL